MQDEKTEGGKEDQVDEDLYVNTDHKGMKKIEILGAGRSFKERADVFHSYEIMLEFQKISELGPPGSLSSTIPNCMYLYLDKNLLYNWD